MKFTIVLLVAARELFIKVRVVHMYESFLFLWSFEPADWIKLDGWSIEFPMVRYLLYASH